MAFVGLNKKQIFPTKFIYCVKLTRDLALSSTTGRCQYLDHRYDEGQVMVPDDKCNYQCTCYVSEYFVGFLCEPLCHRYIDYVDCMPGYEMKSRRVPAGPLEFGCECKVLECVPSFDIESFLNSRKLQGM